MTRNYDVDAIKYLKVEINQMDPVDLEDSLQDMDSVSVALWLKLLDKDKAVNTFAELDGDTKRQLIDIYTDDAIRSMIKELDEDEMVDTLQELSANMVCRLMDEFVTGEHRIIVNKLLGYPEDSVGTIMTVEFLSIKASFCTEYILEWVLHSPLGRQAGADLDHRRIPGALGLCLLGRCHVLQR
ncbi:magnesium transporter MgtE N-terminal domain-containing protein [Peptoniphilus asaccharolyticus]